MIKKKIIKYKDFINESNKIDDSLEEKILKQMSDFIQKRFNNEDRIVFTYWIAEILDYNNFLFISKVEFSEWVKDINHVYIIINDKYYDGDGFHSKEEIYKKHKISKYTFNDFTYNGNLEDIKKYLDKKDIKINSKKIKEFKHIVEQFKNKLK